MWGRRSGRYSLEFFATAYINIFSYWEMSMSYDMSEYDRTIICSHSLESFATFYVNNWLYIRERERELRGKLLM